jgi:branched-chain amino acid transport system substrate-binding protein
MTMNTYARDVEYNELTKPFMDNYMKRFGTVPTYTADTYTAISKTLVSAIEKTGSLDPEKLIPVIESSEHMVASGKAAFFKDAEGRPTHDLKWGPGYLTSLGVQWQDGKLVGVWPNNWKASAEAPEVTYKGMVPYLIPPYMVEKYKK